MPEGPEPVDSHTPDRPDAPPRRQTDPPRDGDGKWVRSIETAERDAEAARLRARGMSYRQIGAELGMHHSSVADAVQRALRDTVAEPAEDVRRLELDRLDHMYQQVLAVLERKHITVSNGKVIQVPDPETGEIAPLEDDAPVLQAVDRLLRISESRRKLLGLDIPVKQQVEVDGGVRYEIVGVDLGQP